MFRVSGADTRPRRPLSTRVASKAVKCQCSLEHVLDAPKQLSLRQFCAGFFHIEETPEAGIPAKCLMRPSSSSCSRKTVSLVVRLQRRAVRTGRWQDIPGVSPRVYTNCSEQQVHAESFMANDRGLRRLLKRGQRLVMYQTYQPCHYSCGHSRWEIGRGRGISCTKLVMDFVEKVLRPLHVQLLIKCAHIYRAFWETVSTPATAKYAAAITNAQLGLTLLQRLPSPRVRLSGFEDDDWTYIVSLCQPGVQQEFHKATSTTFTEEFRQARRRLDRFVESVLSSSVPADVLRSLQWRRPSKDIVEQKHL